MNAKQQLKMYLDAGYSVVGIETKDDLVADKVIREAVDGFVGAVWEYDNSCAGADFRTKAPIGSGVVFADGLSSSGTIDCGAMLCEFLDRVITDCRPVNCVMVMRDVNEQLRLPQVVARIKKIARLNATGCGEGGGYLVRMIIVSGALDLPHELDGISTVVSLPSPTSAEQTRLLKDYLTQKGILLDDISRGAVVDALGGLCESAALRILDVARGRADGAPAWQFVKEVRAEKARIVKKSGLMEVVDVSEDLEGMAGGLENLFGYVDHVATLFRNVESAQRFGVDVPRGMLIAGMPGCGKSLAAKAAAARFGVPLLRLDAGRLMGKYVGESERNLREALAMAEAASPCVLWIDEIEKAFAGIGAGADGGVATRLFGHFLTWMSEKRRLVYTIATANDVTCLPPELMRRGRFDELFSVDLPDEDECRKILEVHLKRRGQSVAATDLDGLAKQVHVRGYSGADIESLVKTAVEVVFDRRMRARDAGRSDWEDVAMCTKDIYDVMPLVHSVQETMGKKIEALRLRLKDFGMTPATKPQ